jgi:hypothetical protein
MLGTPRSIGWPRSRTAARATARRSRGVATRVRLNLTPRCAVNGREDESGGETLGGTTGAMDGCGSVGILAALPMPEGSLTDPLSPRAFAGPGGMPLTPASCAGDRDGAATRHSSASAANTVRAGVPRPEKIETSCARVMDFPRRTSAPSGGRTGKPEPKFQGDVPKGAASSPSNRLALVKPE